MELLKQDICTDMPFVTITYLHISIGGQVDQETTDVPLTSAPPVSSSSQKTETVKGWDEQQVMVWLKDTGINLYV